MALDAQIICEKCLAIYQTPTVAFCEPCHAYWLNGKQLPSVSQVIRAVYPQKSFDGVDPAVIENARERGVLVERYLCEYVRTGAVRTDDGERADVLERLDIVIPWWEKNMADKAIECQKIVSDGAIAGTADFVFSIPRSGYIDYRVIDLKNTASPEKDWPLQGAAYGQLYGDGVVYGCAVLHVSPKRYKEGVKLIEYDYQRAFEWWLKARDWYFAMKEIAA